LRLFTCVRLFSYVVARDYGFAPNPFHGWCTLATCKPRIRATADLGDWILGTGSGPRGLAGHAVYAMRVDETLSFEQYWSDPRFRPKRPNLAGSRKHAFGDNIYRRDARGEWQQLDSHHSFRDGSQNSENLKTDTSVDRVLVSGHFFYWGGMGPTIPERFRSFGAAGEDVCHATQAHRCRFSDALVDEVVSWLESFDAAGCVGRPDRWPLAQ
jgi:Nucleotide modification associated domain 2